MYQIDTENNTIVELKECTFSDLGFKERENLQEWIAKQPSVLGEELLIIQKEFAGFDDTQERLDLLALDKQGSLVIIENKLDDSGKDVTWQALKYASYCSSLSKDNIRTIYQKYLDSTSPSEKAEENLLEFLEKDDYEEISLNKGVTQRIILIAANFRKEVTSTVLWLLNYKVRLQCFRAIPFSKGDELFLTVDQVIPTQDAEEYMIGMAEKAQDEISDQTIEGRRKALNRKFWSRLLEVMREKPTDLFKQIKTTDYHWIGTSSGVRKIAYNFAAAKSYGRVELYIDRGDREENKYIFDELFKRKEEIENIFDGELVWDRLDNRRASKVQSGISGNIFDEEQWEKMITYMTEAMVNLERAFKNPIKDVSKKLK